MDTIKTINGIINADRGNVVFSASDFKFTFMNANPDGEQIVLKVDESGYIWGTTYDKRIIAMGSSLH